MALLIELIIGLSLPLTFGNRFKPLLPPLVDPRKLNMALKEEENKFIDLLEILFHSSVRIVQQCVIL